MPSPLVLFDARDGHATPLRGWGRYALELSRRLAAACAPDLRLAQVTAGGPLPEVAFEQVGLPLRAARLRAALVHAPSCFLPLVRGRAKGVVTVHDLAFEAMPEDFSRVTGAKFRLVTPRAARGADAVVVDTAWTADDLVARYGVDRGRIHVVPLAPSLARGDAPVPGGGPYVLAVGDLRGKKNLGVLVEAWGRAATGHRLVLAGSGTPPEGLPDGVETTGYVSDAELDALMRGADLLVHPSLYEGFGLVLLEAMVRGTPVACADATALPETAGGAAVLFDPRDPDDVARAIVEALADAPRLREAGLAHAAGFSWERTAAMTADVYREVLAA